MRIVSIKLVISRDSSHTDPGELYWNLKKGSDYELMEFSNIKQSNSPKKENAKNDFSCENSPDASRDGQMFWADSESNPEWINECIRIMRGLLEEHSAIHFLNKDSQVCRSKCFWCFSCWYVILSSKS